MKTWGAPGLLIFATKAIQKKTLWKRLLYGATFFLFLQFAAILGANMAPCWPPKSWKILIWTESGRLLGVLGQLQEVLWCCQEALGRLQEVWEGFW